MLLTCPSCNSKYLLNSADLKPKGRQVKCVRCDHDWFQEVSSSDENVYTSSIHSTSMKKTIAENKKEVNENDGEVLSQSLNLPSTYVKEKKSSILNSFLVIIFLTISITSVILIKNEGLNIMVLANFYLQEFYFNLKLIINDFAAIIYQVLD